MFISGKSAIFDMAPAAPDWILPASSYFTFDQQAVDVALSEQRGTTKVPRYGGADVTIGGYVSFSMKGKVYLDLTTGRVVWVNITTPGTGYTSAPTVSFTSGGGSAAAGGAIIGTDGAVKGVIMTNYGTGYTSAPTVGFAGGGGASAAATAYINTYTDAIFQLLMAADQVAVRFSPAGSGASTKRPIYTGTMVLTQKDMDVPSAGPISFTFSAEGSGSLTRTEY